MNLDLIHRSSKFHFFKVNVFLIPVVVILFSNTTDDFEVIDLRRKGPFARIDFIVWLIKIISLTLQELCANWEPRFPLVVFRIPEGFRFCSMYI